MSQLTQWCVPSAMIFLRGEYDIICTDVILVSVQIVCALFMFDESRKRW